MKKIFLLVTLVSLILITTTLVSADSPKSAIVIHDDTCWIADGSGSFDFDDLWEIPDCCTTVVTNSANDNKIISCQGQLPPEAQMPEETMILNYKSTGFECWWDENTTTTKYQFTLTPTGLVNFYCVFK